MQENTTLASETKQPHPGAASAPQGWGAEQREKQKVPQSHSEETAPTPPPNKIKKQPKENKKGGRGENHLIESQRLENPPGVCEDEMPWSLRAQPGFPCPREGHRSLWRQLDGAAGSSIPLRTCAFPPSDPRESSGLRGQDSPWPWRRNQHEGRAQSREKRGQRTDPRAKTAAALFPAVLPCTCPGMMLELGSCWPGGWGSHCSFAQPCLNLLSLVIDLKVETDRSKHKVSKPAY